MRLLVAASPEDSLLFSSNVRDLFDRECSQEKRAFLGLWPAYGTHRRDWQGMFGSKIAFLRPDGRAHIVNFVPLAPNGQLGYSRIVANHFPPPILRRSHT
jgi:hypothetical protein